jgi:ribosomal protein S27AE
MMNERLNIYCPRCGEGRLKVWNDLDHEERELVRRLPASTEYDAAERQRSHRWCPRCWHEEPHDQQSA